MQSFMKMKSIRERETFDNYYNSPWQSTITNKPVTISAPETKYTLTNRFRPMV